MKKVKMTALEPVAIGGVQAGPLEVDQSFETDEDQAKELERRKLAKPVPSKAKADK